MSAGLTVFDGHDTIGGTKLLFEQGENRLLLDFGTNYKRMGQFFEEYLQPRPSRGLVDYLETGLLPRIRGAYRRDLFPPHDYPTKDDEWDGARPTTVLLSHGHLDHCGAMAFLDPSIPVLSTPMTLALLRSWQETGKSDITSEITYYGARAPAGGSGRAKGSLAGRLLESDRSAPKASRPFALFGEVPGALTSALRSSPFGGKTEFVPTDPTPAPHGVDDLRWSCHPVDHSVYGAAAYLLETDGALVAYSGDIRFHGEMGPKTSEFLKRLEEKRPEVLVMEGTKLLATDDPAIQSRTTEEDVERNCRKDVEAYRGKLVIADFGPRNVERLKTFERIALDTGRQLVLTPKDAYLLHLLHTVDPSIPVDISPGGMRVLEEPSVGFEKSWQERVRHDAPDARINPRDVAASPEKWIVCFSFFDCNDLIDLHREGATAGGLWLYSSSEAHGEEQEFDFVRLQKWIGWAGMHQVGFRYGTDETGRPRLSFDHPDDVGHHASGHATQSELVEFVERAHPKLLVPVHSEQPPSRYAELLKARGSDVKVVAPAQGQRITW